jgi:hypothetical protein
MSMQGHILELEKRHHAIEKEIESELQHSSADNLKIVELKRKKLKIKEEIVRHQAGNGAGRLH